MECVGLALVLVNSIEADYYCMIAEETSSKTYVEVPSAS